MTGFAPNLHDAYRTFPIPGRWCVHSYYTLPPWAPDGSERLLVSGCDLDRETGEVFILHSDGSVADHFGEHSVSASFYHTGFWATWSPDARFVYYQGGSLHKPGIVRRELATGREVSIHGDMEGTPPHGQPVVSGLMGMLYAAGYGYMSYDPSISPVPFQQRDHHGLFEYTLEPESAQLRLTTNEVLERHPDRARLTEEDNLCRQKHGADDGLTLMLYCVRWNRQGSRFLFYFGNHNTVSERGEPKIGYVMTARHDFSDVHLAVDLSFGRQGNHWSWHPDGEHLLGYGPTPEDPTKACLATVRYDGSNYRRLSSHASYGHPSVCPANHNLAVTDRYAPNASVSLIDLRTDTELVRLRPGAMYGDEFKRGRHPFRVCHHPVFHPSGTKILFNTLAGRHAFVAEYDVTETLAGLGHPDSAT